MKALAMGAAALLGLALLARDGRGEDGTTGRAACFKAYVDEQALRDRGQLRAAREAALTCARDVCPALVSKDCVGWMRELDASIPSASISVTDGDGRLRLDARVTIDGASVGRLDGTSVPLDPGAHQVRCELPGEPALALTLVLMQGEHDKPVRIAYPPRASLSPRGTDATSRPLPGYVLALGGASVVALGVWAVTGALGLWGSPSNRTIQQCYGHCAASDISTVKTELAVADVAGVAALALGAATVWFYLDRPAAPPSTGSALAMTANLSARF